MAVEIEPSWLKVLGNEFDKPYMTDLKKFLQEEKLAGYKIYPKGSDIFNAFNKTPFDKLKVVILGQDPYHGENQAHGLSFSVKRGIAIPPSLQNIYKELATDIPGFTIPNHGDLTEWAEQGVLLLNATLTVGAGLPNSHQKFGWGTFTETVINKISKEKEGIVFILWGNFAKSKSAFIENKSKHFILESAHPSPLSISKGDFYGSKPFSKTNEILVKAGKEPIDWQIH